MTVTQPSTLRALAVTIVAVGILSLALRVVDAGSLTPVAVPAATMNSLSDIYDALVGTSYDSSAMDIDIDGNAIEVARCVLARMTGGTCPGTAISFSLYSGLSANLMANGGASDCDGDGDLDDGCFTAFCSDFLAAPPSGTYNRAVGDYGGETRETPTCAFSVIATCDEIGTSSVSISFCNGGLCVTQDTDFTITDSGPVCPP